MTPPAPVSDRYELLQPLGSGGQGHTFRARDRQTGDEVAVKVIQLRGADGWKPFDLFERECRVLRTLDHPGIPKFLDTFAEPDAGQYCLVMELVPGTSLVELLRDGEPAPRSQLWNYLHQALVILEYLHRLNPPVIHRDVKPANLIRRDDGRLSLVDFGGVRVALRPEGGSTVVGTFGYMAPEQLHGEATPATDVYGLGATLAALACGLEADKLPHKGLAVDLESVMSGSSLRELLSRMTRPDPQQRLQTVQQVRDAIKEIQGQTMRLPVPAPPAPVAPEPEPLAPQEPADPGPLRDVPGPLLLVLRLVGLMGYLGLAIVDAVFLPLLFALLSTDKSDKQKKLETTRGKVRRALTNGKRSMKALARGRDPYRPHRRLPPGPRRPRRPRLPPGPRRGRRRGPGPGSRRR
jgi:serine/threonine protein kinase